MRSSANYAITVDGISAGGGVSSSLGGSSVAERNLDRITIALALIWVTAIVALGLFLKAA